MHTHDDNLLQDLLCIIKIQDILSMETLQYVLCHSIDYFADKYCIQNDEAELYQVLCELQKSIQKPTVNDMLQLCEDKNILKRHFHTKYISAETPKAFGDDFAAFCGIKDGIQPGAFDEMCRFVYNHTTADFNIGIEVHNESGEDIVIKNGEHLNLGELNSQMATFIKIDENDTPEYRNYGIADIRLTIYEEE
jgi:hypothetical protein